MKRNVTFLRPFAVALLWPLGLVACAGKTVSVGTNEDQLRTVDPASVNKPVPACAAKTQAHANVCCKGGPGEEGACHAFIGKPFHPCDTGFNTYPDPEECCDLSNPASCDRPPPGPPDPGGSCGYTCPPGWYSNTDPNPGGFSQGTSCCRTIQLPNGATTGECYAEASGGRPDTPTSNGPTPVPPGWVDGGLPIDGGRAGDGAPGDVDGGAPGFDGGIETDAAPPPLPPNPCGYRNGDGPVPVPVHDPSTPPGTGNKGQPAPGPDQCPPPPPSTCNLACPPGFTAAINDPAICCQDTPNGDICFSQAQGPSGGWGGPGSTPPGVGEPKQPTPAPATDAGAPKR